MTDTAQASDRTAPVLVDLPDPAPVTALPTLSGPAFTPQQILFFYSPDEWEDFILEWASVLKESYVETKRLGGSNDHGVDVAAFKTNNGFEGPWDCYQGKHYADSLVPSDAHPEMLKIFIGVLENQFQMPDVYYFVAPKGCGGTLDRLLSKPTELRQKFLAELDKSKGCAASLDSERREEVRVLAEKTDFSIFRSMKLLDALETHRKTPYYVARFGGPLPSRPPNQPPPEDFGDDETPYVTQLVDVYAERSTSEKITKDTVASHPIHGRHFKRQRIAFFSADALYRHTRDAVPEGTFQALQDDIHAGVVEAAEAEYPTGMERLTAVLTVATHVQLDAHAALLSVSRVDDRKGICHRLANEGRLSWVTATR